MKAPAELECIRDPDRAAAVLSPFRLDILRRAQEPRSATEIAADLGLPRQRVNYHVRALFAAGFLERAGRRKRRNMYEQRYRATARSYLLSPELLGPVGSRVEAIRDRLGTTFLLALAARCQDEVMRAGHAAATRDERVPAIAFDAELRFKSAAQRQRFAAALAAAVADAIREHTAPAERADGRPAAGEPFRLLVGCHPIPPAPDDATPLKSKGS